MKKTIHQDLAEMLEWIGALVKGANVENIPLGNRSRRKNILQPFRIFYSLVSVSLIFFWGLAFTTLRNRKPIRFNTAAMVLGEGNCSSL